MKLQGTPAWLNNGRISEARNLDFEVDFIIIIMFRKD